MVNFAKLKLFILTSLLVVSPTLLAGDYCLKNVVSSLSDEAYVSPEIAPWSMVEMNLNLKPEQILPETYLNQLKKASHEVTVSMKSDKSRIELKVSVDNVVSNKKDILTLYLLENIDDPKMLMVDNLSLKDPLNVNVAKLNASQSEKGLPIAIVNHIKKQFFKIAKAGNYQKIGAAGTQNYLVTLFYLRSIGMKPVDKKSQQLIDFCQELYLYARKNLPEGLRPKGLDDFAKMLGGHDFSPLDKSSEIIFLNYGNFKTLPAGFEALKDANGIVIGFVNHREIRTNFSKVYFIDRMAKHPRLFQWENYSNKRFPRLEVNIQ